MKVRIEIDGNIEMHDIDYVQITFVSGEKHIADRFVSSIKIVKSKKESESAKPAKLASGDSMWEDGER